MRLLLKTSDEPEQNGGIAVTRYMMRINLVMAAGLAVTAGAAALVAREDALRGVVYTSTGLTGFGWAVLLAPLLLVIAISGAVHRITASAARTLFLAYAVLMGLSLGLLAYSATGQSLGLTLLATAGAYGMMALMGWTGRTDFSPLAIFILLPLFALALLLMVDATAGSFSQNLALSAAVIVLVAALTAFDVQRLRRLYLSGEVQTAAVGALTLYLDFIDMFLAMLRITRRR